MANAAACFSALGDSTRRQIFERLSKRPSSVAKVAAGLSVSRPAVSQHLKVLKLAGLVIDRVEGTRRVYQINSKGVEAMRNYLDRFWDQAMAAFTAAAEEDDQ
jgi:DNA-binding transcriptional ArsR family regulator